MATGRGRSGELCQPATRPCAKWTLEGPYSQRVSLRNSGLPSKRSTSAFDMPGTSRRGAAAGGGRSQRRGLRRNAGGCSRRVGRVGGGLRFRDWRGNGRLRPEHEYPGGQQCQCGSRPAPSAASGPGGRCFQIGRTGQPAVDAGESLEPGQGGVRLGQSGSGSTAVAVRVQLRGDPPPGRLQRGHGSAGSKAEAAQILEQTGGHGEKL